MQKHSHRNWLLLILETHAPAVLWTSSLLMLLVVGVSFFFKPIYTAETILTLDARLGRILTGAIATEEPVTQQSDFIREEYFATHTVSLMRLPELGEKVIVNFDLRDRKGRRILAKDFIQPSFLKLLISNNGQGIDASWIVDTQLFSITGYSTDPDLAVELASEYTVCFLQHNANQFRSVLELFLGRTLRNQQDVEKRIQDIDLKKNAVLQKARTSELSKGIEQVIERIDEVQREHDNIELVESQYKKKYEFLVQESQKLGELKRYESSLESNPQVASLKAEIQSLSESIVSFALEYTPEHLSYKTIEAKLRYAEEALRKEAEKTFERETYRVSGLRDETLSALMNLTVDHMLYQIKSSHYNALRSRLQARLEELNSIQPQIDNLNKEKDTLSNIFLTYSTTIEGLEMLISQTAPFLRVVSPARIDKERLNYFKYFPKRKKLGAITFLASLILGVFLIIGRDIYANKLYTGWQLKAALGDIVYAEMFHYKQKRKNKKRSPLGAKELEPVLLAARPSKILRIVSIDPHEGKAFCAIALAKRYRQMGESVALVDGDFEKRSLTRFYGLENAPGLSESLAEKKRWEEVLIREYEKEIGSLLPAGQTELLDNDKANILLPAMFSQMKEVYDKLIFIDTPASSSWVGVKDLLPPHKVILVVRSGKHSLYDLQEIERQYRIAGQVFAGIIVNKMPYRADLFSLVGMIDLLRHLVSEPLRLIRSLLYRCIRGQRRSISLL